MLDPWIIEEIRRREEQREREAVVQIEISIERPDYRDGEAARQPSQADETTERGVTVIEF
jgi:hypothetical protein